MRLEYLFHNKKGDATSSFFFYYQICEKQFELPYKHIAWYSGDPNPIGAVELSWLLRARRCGGEA